MLFSNSFSALVTYGYKAGNGRLKSVTYANGDTMKATYNSIGQMIAEKWYDSTETLTAHYKYVYDTQGNIVRSIDITAQKEYDYMYENGTLVRSAEYDITINNELVTAKTHVASTRYYYDAEGNLTKKRIIHADGTENIIYYETTDDNTVVKFDVPDIENTNKKRTITSRSSTDSFGRKTFDELQLGTGFVSRQFAYFAGDIPDEHKDNGKVKSAATTTNLVSQIILSDGRTISYEYDEEERITKVTDSIDGTYEYTYDSLGQLLTETVTRDGETTVANSMTYTDEDHPGCYGNILIKNGVVYEYDTVWKDKLVKVGNDTITYDSQGNPTSYLGHILTWEKGRQLKSFDSNTYTYNANGIRTSKTIDGIKHTYTLDGAKILREAWTVGNETNSIVPLYDNEDAVCGITYNGTTYFFLKNLQGDVIAITDADSETVARYTYDAWGVCTTLNPDGTTNSDVAFIGNINPYRYRSYYYDSEIGMYYLQSRYYNPIIGRFVNGDDPDTITTGNIKHSTDLYCYCSNNPVNETDAYGNLVASAIAKFVIYAVFGVFVQFVSDIIEFLLRKFIKKNNVSFGLSPLGDYLGSALSWGMCSMNLFNNKVAAFLAPFVPVIVKHLTNFIRGSISWHAFLVDFAAAFIAGIISVALNKSMKNKLSQVKRGKGNRYSEYSKYLNKRQKIVIKINKSFLKASLTIVIATTLMQLLLNLLLK